MLKAVITCGGRGTRLLPFTKELPKEMAPVFYKSTGKIQMFPLLQLIFEKLYDSGIRDFCFVSAKDKRSIEDHFIPDSSRSEYLEEFFCKLRKSKIFWITQQAPCGFGDAVKYSEPFVENDGFILQAGDVAVLKKNKSVIDQIIELSKSGKYDGILCVREVSEPKRHGVVELEDSDATQSLIKSAEEKPEEPRSDLGIMPIYYFNNSIFDALDKIPPGKNSELQVTDAVQHLIERGRKILAIRVDSEMFWDTGTPASYWDALKQSYELARGKR